MRSFLMITLAMAISFSGVGQDKKWSRIQPGAFYEAGEGLYAPRLGFKATVPKGWQGSLPRESEVFLLQTVTTDLFGEIFVFDRESIGLEELKKKWIEGTDLSESIRITANDPQVKGDMLVAEVVGEGKAINKSNRGYAVARCNPTGPCVVALAVMPRQFYDPIREVAEKFIREGTFENPSSAPPYAGFDWQDFLGQKMFLTYAYMENGSKESEIQFCSDGTFKANVRKKGLFENQKPQYKGKLAGKWTTKGVGETTQLTLEFNSKKELPPLVVELTIRDDQVFVGKERYFVAQSSGCVAR
ncbi:MAG: hypothetical protein ACK5DD_12285 [Cyclobacteriaceae bacterium]|jgi:hypothetical protein